MVFFGREANKREALQAERQARIVALVQDDFWDDTNLEDVQLALDNGADIHAQDTLGFTPLHHWANSNIQDTNILILLLDYGADVNARDEAGYTPLQLAIMRDQGLDTIQLLLDRGGDAQLANGGRMDLLRFAAANNTHIEIFALLLDGEGININEPNEHNQTLLHNAASGNETPSVTEIFLDHGADVHATNPDGDTPLHKSAEWNENPAVTGMLLEHGAQVEARNNMGQTPLHLAIRGNQEIEVIKVLLAGGASTQAISGSGDVPLQWAELYERPDVANLLTTDEQKARGEHCIYKVTDEIDEAIMGRLRSPDSYWPHRETMVIGRQYEMETAKGSYSMVHNIAMDFSATNADGWTVRGTAFGVMFNENCFVVIQNIR